MSGITLLISVLGVVSALAALQSLLGAIGYLRYARRETEPAGGAAGADGNNGGWAQTHGGVAASATQLFLSIDEDTIGDGDRSHTTEQVGYFVSLTPISIP